MTVAQPSPQPAAPGVGARPDEVPWTHCLFQQPWWLDAVAPGRWDEVRVEHGGAVVGRLPFVVKERAGLRSLSEPPLTQGLGPWVAPHDGKQATRLAAEKRIMGELIDRLPRFAAFHQSFAPEVRNWLPFHWAGFEATVRYTFRLEDLTDLEAVWNGFSSQYRREIRKCDREFEVRTEPDIDALTDLVLGRLARKGVRVGFDAALLRRLDAACARRDARRMFFAVDPRGEVHAAVYLVWDGRAAYNLLAAHSGQAGRETGFKLLIWEAIQFAAGVSRVFDFEGSMIEPIERVFRDFGPTRRPYLRVSRVSPAIAPLWALRGRGD